MNAVNIKECIVMVILLIFPSVYVEAESKLRNCTKIENLEESLACIKSNEAILKRETGHIVGVITDEKTGLPLGNVYVSANYMGDSTDAKGEFNVPYQYPGIAHLVAYRRDLIEFKTSVKIVAGKATKIDFSMKREKKPCCRLKGDWHTILRYNKNTKIKEIKGTISFNDNLPGRYRNKVENDGIIDEFGRYNIDLKLLFGDSFYKTRSTTISTRNKETLLSEVEGNVYQDNHVTITLIPRMSHGGLILSGKIAHNTISGTWLRMDYASSQGGEFIMKKVIKQNSAR